jgi:hypothetical protein
MSFVKARQDPIIAPTTVIYRSLDYLSHVEVFLHSDNKYYLRGVSRDGAYSFFFGPSVGYASSALAVTAMDAAITPVLA